MQSVELETVYRTSDPEHLLFQNRIRVVQPGGTDLDEYFEGRHWENDSLERCVQYGMELGEKEGQVFTWLTATNRGAPRRAAPPAAPRRHRLAFAASCTFSSWSSAFAVHVLVSASAGAASFPTTILHTATCRARHMALALSATQTFARSIPAAQLAPFAARLAFP